MVRLMLHFLLVGGLLLGGLVGCTALTGKTLGENVDDATITAVVKAELAREEPKTLTRIDVDTNRGVVSLNGMVESAAMERRAIELARQVRGVRQVVSHLKVQDQ